MKLRMTKGKLFGRKARFGERKASRKIIYTGTVLVVISRLEPPWLISNSTLVDDVTHYSLL
jgi:hypothetical protein